MIAGEAGMSRIYAFPRAESIGCTGPRCPYGCVRMVTVAVHEPKWSWFRTPILNLQRLLHNIAKLNKLIADLRRLSTLFDVRVRTSAGHLFTPPSHTQQGHRLAGNLGRGDLPLPRTCKNTGGSNLTCIHFYRDGNDLHLPLNLNFG